MPLTAAECLVMAESVDWYPKEFAFSWSCSREFNFSAIDAEHIEAAVLREFG